jgi:26S proteasome non-ATPase regulatory subunit 10
VLQLLLANDADVEARDSLGWAPIIIAAAAGQPEVVTELLDRGAKVDAANDKGQTALHYAASKGNTSVGGILLDNTNSQMGRLLIGRGADVSS